MDTATVKTSSDAKTIFDTGRIAIEVDELAKKHAGNNDVFRSAMAQLLKAKLADARVKIQAELLKDVRAGNVRALVRSPG